MWTAFEDVMSLGGVMAEADYPYTGSDGKCHYNETGFAVTITNYTCFSGPDLLMKNS